jgi:enoyl-[acyl-carrier protein] reductase/trans-2-enoyl-CoA reductase (NAD+)
LDDQRRIRLDDHELSVEVLDQVKQAWTQINTENLYQLADYKRYKVGFRNLFGFEVDDVDYDQAVETELLLP